VPTPPVPEYDSGHSVQGAAAATVLARVLGTDRVAFSACSLTLPPGSRCGEPGEAIRRYRSFSHAAAENGRSRVLAGIHFGTAVEVGIEHGGAVAERVVERALRPDR
jgi:PAP2 superfamily